jgi:streptogramin lyase
MLSLKLIGIFVAIIVGVVVIVAGIGLFSSFRPAFMAGNNERLSTTQGFKQSSSSQLHSIPLKKLEGAGESGDDNAIIHQVFLNNLTHIDTPYVKEYSMPNGTWPNSILVARNGLVWTVGTKSDTLISFDPKQGKIISSYPITTNNKEKTGRPTQGFQMVWSIVEDNDGSIWIPQGGSDPLWRFDPQTGKFQIIHSISVAPMQMKVDDRTGNIWFTTFGRGTFGVIQKVIGKGNATTTINPEYKATEFNLGNESFPSGIFLQGGSIWIIETLNQNKIVEFRPIVDPNGRVVNVTKVLEIPSSSSSATPAPLSNQSKQLFTTPTDLVVFANSNNSTRPSSIWVPEHGTSFITEYSFDSKTVVRFPTSSSPRHYTTLPYWISEPANHKGFWFNEHEGNRIAFFNTTSMTLSEYEVPTRDPLNAYLANALTLSADPHDNNKVWFTEFNHDKIGVLDTSPSVPFDINSSVSNISILSPSINKDIQKNASLPGGAARNILVISKEPFNNNNNHLIVFLNASSSMNPLGRFVNMSAKFSPSSVINLTKTRPDQSTHIVLQRNNITIPVGNYTLGISATDAKVTKSIFRNLIVGQQK